MKRTAQLLRLTAQAVSRSQNLCSTNYALPKNGNKTPWREQSIRRHHRACFRPKKVSNRTPELLNCTYKKQSVGLTGSALNNVRFSYVFLHRFLYRDVISMSIYAYTSREFLLWYATWDSNTDLAGCQVRIFSRVRVKVLHRRQKGGRIGEREHKRGSGEGEKCAQILMQSGKN